MGCGDQKDGEEEEEERRGKKRKKVEEKSKCRMSGLPRDSQLLTLLLCVGVSSTFALAIWIPKLL